MDNKKNPEVEPVTELEIEPISDFPITIIVNARKHEWNEKEISFEEVVKIAFGSISPNPNIVYTVIYKKGPKGNPEGSMVKGDKVKVQEGMVFNATSTDKS